MDTIGIIAAVLGSGGFGAAINAFLNRDKNKVEMQDIIGNVYGDLITECRSQINHQANQLKAMQDREVQWVKIIAGYQETERDLRQQIQALEKKLGDYIHKQEELN